MAARVDAVASRVQSAVTMQSVTKNIGGVTKALDRAMGSMDLEKVSKIMEDFETQFENLDVKTQTVEQTMSQATTLATPEDDVNALIAEVAAEHGLEIQGQLSGLGVASDTVKSADAKKEDELDRRLASLRN